MKRVPELLFVVDVTREDTAIHEANMQGIPVIAMVDTNCDPRGVDYVIPSNDDAIRAIKLMVGKIADAVIEGKTMVKEDDLESGATVETPAVRAASGVHPRIDEELDLEDDLLLGAATLAKLGGKPEVETAEVVEEVAEEVIEPVAEVVAPVKAKRTKKAVTVEPESDETK